MFVDRNHNNEDYRDNYFESRCFKIDNVCYFILEYYQSSELLRKQMNKFIDYYCDKMSEWYDDIIFLVDNDERYSLFQYDENDEQKKKIWKKRERSRLTEIEGLKEIFEIKQKRDINDYFCYEQMYIYRFRSQYKEMKESIEFQEECSRKKRFIKKESKGRYYYHSNGANRNHKSYRNNKRKYKYNRW